MEHREASSKTQLLKSVAFSTFTSSMWSLGYSIMGRPLTGFGPAAAAEVILRRRAVSHVSYFLFISDSFQSAVLTSLQPLTCFSS